MATIKEAVISSKERQDCDQNDSEDEDITLITRYSATQGDSDWNSCCRPCFIIKHFSTITFIWQEIQVHQNPMSMIKVQAHIHKNPTVHEQNNMWTS